MEEKQEINDELSMLLRQLVMQNQLLMAGLVLQTYFIRKWQIDEVLAGKYVRCYFNKYYPKQLERYLKRQNRDC